MDGALRIIHWNKASEKLLGMSARAVLGKPCYEVLQGRDANGNTYCHRGCPVAQQARGRKERVHPFGLSVKGGDGSRTEVSTSLFSIPSYHPALATLVHVFREKGTVPFAHPSAPPSREPLAPVGPAAEEQVALTSREREVLSGLVKGLTTVALAKELFIAPATVRNHIASLLQKFAVHTRLAAVAFAHQHELV
jgi:DNA-binding CsgD family transcriptional regulator